MTTGASREDVCVGVDIGGTAVRIVLLHNGRAAASQSVSTISFASASVDQRVERLAALIRGMLTDQMTLAAVGIGASGPIDIHRGVIANPYTLAAFSDFPIVAALKAKLGCPVVIESDAVVAAIAEHRLGAGRRADRLVLVTLGTGIGVSFLIEGVPFRGPSGVHPEGGHIPVISSTERCYCGITGCWETVASRLALQTRLSPLLPPDTPPELILPSAAALASPGSPVQDAFTTYGRLIGRGLCALQVLYMPDVVVLGGSVAAHFGLFSAGVYDQLQRPADYIPPMTVAAAAMPEPGAIGAALLAQNHKSDL